MEVSVKTNVKLASKSLKNYEKKQLPPAVTRALNRTLRGTVTDTKRLIAKEINLTQAEIGKEIHVRKATGKTGNAYRAKLTVKGGFKRNLASFKGVRPTKKGLSGKIWKKNTKYPGAFIWKRKIASGNTAETAFHRVKGAEKVVSKQGHYKGRKITRGPRKGKAIKRQPIKPIYGDSVINIFVREGRNGSVRKALLKTIPARFDVELGRQIARMRG